MVNRWSIALQELDYTIEYIADSNNHLADAMSRLRPNLTPVPTVPDSVPSDIAEAVVSALHEIIPVSDSQLEKSRCLITPWWDMEEYYEPLNTSKG